MKQRSARAEADLIVAELEAILANNPLQDFYASSVAFAQLDRCVERLEHLLGESLPNLRHEESDVAPEPRSRQSGPTLYLAERLRTKAQSALAYARSVDSRRSSVVEERFQLLATLVDAYDVNSAAFTVVHYAGEPYPRIEHPGLDEPLLVQRSHLDALAHDGLIFWSPRGSEYRQSFSIPTRVLLDFEKGAGLEMSLPSGPRRREALRESSTVVYYTNNIHPGAQANISNTSRDVQQSMATGIAPGDVAALLEGLRRAGVPDEAIDDLATRLDDVGEVDAQRGVVWSWFGEVARGALGGALGDALPTVATMVASFAAGMV